MPPGPADPSARAAALASANAELRREVDRLRAERETLAARLHDLKQLTSVIVGHGDLLVRRLPHGEPLRRSAESIQQAAESSADVVHRLLARARRAERPAPLVDLNEVVVAVLGMLEATLRPRIDVVTRLESALGAVRADRAEIEQVLVNLVVNAHDAMQAGQRLMIDTANVDVTAAANPSAGAVPGGSYVAVTIGDAGGATDMAAPRPWVPGLGLSTAHAIVRGLGGSITFASTVNRGSTFRLYLPRVADVAPRAAAAVATPARSTILVVEDETQLRELVREVLEVEGYAVVPARDGAEALALADRHGGEMHLLVTDVVMPSAHPAAVVRCLRVRWPALRVLYVSGRPDDDVAPRLVQLGAPVLRKPFRVASLVGAVEYALSG